MQGLSLLFAPLQYRLIDTQKQQDYVGKSFASRYICRGNNPRYIAVEGGFTKGSSVNIEFTNNQIIISKPKTVREGWAAAFAQYAKEGEDAMLLPDYLDSEAVDLL